MPQPVIDKQYEILQNVEALTAFKGKSLLNTYSYADVIAREHALAFTVAKMMDGDMLSETQAAITAALESGTDFRDFEKRLKPYLMSKGWWGEQVMTDPLTGERKLVQLGSTRRLRTIYHTNLHASYAAGQWQRIEETKALLPYLQYMPSVAGEPRNQHKGYYGIVRPVDDPIWQSIMPPNGYGCLCWVKQLTKGQAKRAGISDEVELEMVEVTNPRTGEMVKTPKGIDPSFDHNHDRMSAMNKMYSEKVITWTHVPEAKRAAVIKQHDADRDAYMVGLIQDRTFKAFVPTVGSPDFVRRVGVIAKASKAGAIEGIGIGTAKESHQWAVATLSQSIQGALDVDKYIAWLGEDTLTTMIRAAKHNTEQVVELLHTAQDMLANASELTQLAGGGYETLFISKGITYKATLAVDKTLNTLNIVDLVQV